MEYSDGDSFHKPPYTIVDENRIRQLQDKDISEVCTLLSVSRSLACTLLRRNNWSKNSVFDEWFADEKQVRWSLGLLQKRKPLKLYNQCKICFKSFKVESMLSGPCGHPFCTNCWKSYIAASIDSGPGCLGLRCPEPKCKADPGLELIDTLASDCNKDKYYKYLLGSYVEGCWNLKWCPGPGCNLAVQVEYKELKNYDVTCDCSYEFCWNCTEERHYPVDCRIVDKWTKRNTSKENNTTWIRAFCKPCPGCKRNIERNEGCSHMICPCGHEFCWVCLRPSIETHTYCNANETRKDEWRTLESTRENLKRYARHYECWAWNHKSRESALDSLRLAKKNGKPPFAIEALEQIVESRRVVKWSYAYGYYLPLTEKWRVVYLRSLQLEAEGALERLQYYADRKIEQYANADLPLDELMYFRAELVDMTNLTRNKIEKLVRALENDLREAGAEAEAEISTFSGLVVREQVQIYLWIVWFFIGLCFLLYFAFL
ncbi:hypothetical protein ACP275_06G160800 [Erythranthe tilingii]